jgi:hypothetical protein
MGLIADTICSKGQEFLSSEGPLTRDKLLPAVAIALLAIVPMVISGPLFGQQPTTPSAAGTRSNGKAGAFGGQETPARQAIQTRPAATDKAAADKAAADKAAADKAAADKAAADKAAADKAAADKTAADKAAADKAPDLTLKQAECRSYEKQSTEKWEPKNCKLGDTLFVTFDNLLAWVKGSPTKNNPKDLVLVLDGRVMKGLLARGPDTQQPNELKFDLKRLDLVEGDQDSKANRDAWNTLLRRSKGKQEMRVGVGLAGNPPYFGTVPVTFEVFPSYWPLLVFFFLALLWLFLLLAYNSDILRDGPSPAVVPNRLWFSLARSPAGAPKKLSFSLARCQMAWWFFIILAAFIYIWMVTGDRDSLTSGALILIGISAATGFGAFVVDSSKSDQRQSLQNEQTALTTRLPTLATDVVAVPPPANLADLKAEQQQKTARLAEVTAALSKLPPPPGPSEGFLNDILRDETGVSFHRFQMATWTVVLGLVFALAVYQSLAMPDFSATLLGLMGISAGTYVGFKIPDPPKP